MSCSQPSACAVGSIFSCALKDITPATLSLSPMASNYSLFQWINPISIQTCYQMSTLKEIPSLSLLLPFATIHFSHPPWPKLLRIKIILCTPCLPFSFESGFVPNCSTEGTLAKVMNDLHVAKSDVNLGPHLIWLLRSTWQVECPWLSFFLRSLDNTFTCLSFSYLGSHSLSLSGSSSSASWSL